jgi:archaellum component FlaC
MQRLNDDNDQKVKHQYDNISHHLNSLQGKAIDINTTLQDHNQQLDILDDNISHTQNKLDHVNNKLYQLLKKNYSHRNCCMLILFVCLVVMLFLVAFS